MDVILLLVSPLCDHKQTMPLKIASNGTFILNNEVIQIITNEPRNSNKPTQIWGKFIFEVNVIKPSTIRQFTGANEEE